ncbi:hypothetical protein QAD02_002506 [Eretmocerus hayati]|uniref:Uncharacterized protein n=1 Tax=Eretmocerus hayati TaxID=131215 RepID=A0ACC2NM00_9HYME|nr:hypothetical protein QAD02_002506 [Eretmocerus hayati]
MTDSNQRQKYVVDLQGFYQAGGDYTLKELAFAPLVDVPVVILFKSPFPSQQLPISIKQENKWLRKYYHGLRWTSAAVPYTMIGGILQAALVDADRVFVNHLIKREWLNQFKIDACIIESDYRNERTVTVCENHDAECNIERALHNVKKMQKFLNKSG